MSRTSSCRVAIASVISVTGDPPIREPANYRPLRTTTHALISTLESRQTQTISHLSEHSCLGFNTSHSPSGHTQSIDHGRVRICSHKGVRIQDAVAVEHDSGQILQVHLHNPEHNCQKRRPTTNAAACILSCSSKLGGPSSTGTWFDDWCTNLMHDARARRNYKHILEGRGSPLQKPEPFLVAAKLQLHVRLECVGRTRNIHLHRMVDHQIHGHLIAPRAVQTGHSFQCTEVTPYRSIPHSSLPGLPSHNLGLTGKRSPNRLHGSIMEEHTPED